MRSVSDPSIAGTRYWFVQRFMMIFFIKVKQLAIYFIFTHFFFFGNPAYATKENVFIFPLIGSCEKSVLAALNEVKKLDVLQYQVLKYNAVLESHPDIVGSISLFSKGQSVSMLEAYANSIMFRCYPDIKVTIDINNVIFRKHFLKSLKASGIDNFYIEIDSVNKLFIVHYNDWDNKGP